MLNNAFASLSPADRTVETVRSSVPSIDLPGDELENSLDPHEFKLAQSYAKWNKRRESRDILMNAAKMGQTPEEAIKTANRAQVEGDYAGLVQKMAPQIAELPEDQFQALLDSLKNLPQRPGRVPLNMPSRESLLLSAVGAAFGPVGQSADILAAPFQYQLADQQLRQQEAEADWKADYEAAIAKAKNAGDVLEILSRRQEKEFEQDRLDAREQMRIEGRQTLATMNNQTRIQVAEIALSKSDPVWKRNRLVEMGLSEQEAGQLVTATDRVKIQDARVKDIQARFLEETFEDRVLGETLKNDLLNERITLTGEQTRFLQERVKYYGQEVMGRLAILQATLAQREMQTLIGAMGLYKDIRETPEIKASRKLIADMEQSVAELDAKRKAAMSAVMRLMDPETGDPDSQEAQDAQQAYLDAEAAYRAVKGVLDARKKALTAAESETEPALSGDSVQQAIQAAINRSAGSQGAAPFLSPGTPDPQATGKMPPPLPD